MLLIQDLVTKKTENYAPSKLIIYKSSKSLENNDEYPSYAIVNHQIVMVQPHVIRENTKNFHPLQNTTSKMLLKSTI